MNVYMMFQLAVPQNFIIYCVSMKYHLLRSILLFSHKTLAPKDSKIQNNKSKWKVKFVYTISLGTANIRKNVRKCITFRSARI